MTFPEMVLWHDAVNAAFQKTRWGSEACKFYWLWSASLLEAMFGQNS